MNIPQNGLNFEDVLLDSLPNPVYYKNIKGQFIKCNNSFAKLVNKEKKEIIGKLAYNFFSKETSDRHKIIDEILIKTLDRNDDRIVYTNSSGQTKYLNLTKSVYLDDNGQVSGIVCVMTDITQRIKEKELLIQQSKLAEMGEMIASIAHQWNEPLVELSALVQNIKIFHTLDKIDETYMTHFVQNSIKQLKYMSETLKDFRNFLKPSVKKQAFDIKNVIRQVLEIIGRQLFYYNIHIHLKYIPSNINLYIYGYENEFKQVLLNIINNAKNKISQKNTPINNAKIIISVEKKDNDTLIEIKDNGGAIDDNIIDKIFDPFFTTRANGTGFGLYISKLIIEDKMSGEITVRNNDDFVIFSIKIPHRDLQ